MLAYRRDINLLYTLRSHILCVAVNAMPRISNVVYAMSSDRNVSIIETNTIGNAKLAISTTICA